MYSVETAHRNTLNELGDITFGFWSSFFYGRGFVKKLEKECLINLDFYLHIQPRNSCNYC